MKPPTWWWVLAAIGIAFWVLALFVAGHFVLKYW